MREHEVPTHVQAEDRVLLWFTFPQIVAVVAVCAVAYGAYRYLPLGPAEFRLGVAIALGILGIALTVGRVGGRGLPLVCADLLKFNLGARRYAGSPADLVRPEAPVPEPAVAAPSPIRQFANRAGQALLGLARAAAVRIPRPPSSEPASPEETDPGPAGFKPGLLPPLAGRLGSVLSGLGNSWRRRRGRLPFRPHSWFGKRRNRKDGDGGNSGKRKEPRKGKTRRFSLTLAAVALMAALALPYAALADGPWSDDAWRLDEVQALPPEPVPGRRLYVESLTVTGSLAMIELRAAAELKLDSRAYGGSDGRTLTFFVADHMEQGETAHYGLSLDGPNPSFTFAWQDGLGQTGALALKGQQLPHPLPSAEGAVCSLRADELGWTPGVISGVIISECAAEQEERVSLPVSTGHHRQSVEAVLPAAVTGVTGTLTVSAGGASTGVPFVAGGETRFTLPAAAGEMVHEVAIEAALEASLLVAQPPLVQLTHHPYRVERRTETVSLLRPGTSRYVSRTVSVALPPNGQVVQYSIGATLSIPSETVRKDVTLDIDHPEHVRAEVLQRSPLSRTRADTVSLSTGIGSDASYAALALPEPTPAPPVVEHTPLTGDEAKDLFDRPSWWEWP